ncbi:MAG: hypothetical protein HYX60_09770 [Legionella longbeachae]|nr:hypothetical protein [Legionella longbeachae]
MKSKKINEINSEEIADFFGDLKLEFNSIDKKKSEQFMVMIKEGFLYNEILEKCFSNDIDQFAQSAVYAFSRGKITRDQTGSILEFREMKMLNTKEEIKVFNLLNENNEFTPESHEILHHFVASEEKDVFLKLIKKTPKSDCCYFEITVSDLYLENNPGVDGLLTLANQIKIIKRDPPSIIKREYAKEFDEQSSQEKGVRLILLSISGRNALTQAIYGSHAKFIFPRLKKFSIDDMERSMRSHGRYLALSYPGVEGETSFHKIKANHLFLSMHDEAHRRLISTVPNTAFDALLRAIDVIRQITGIKWSKEIWDSVDMETGSFLNETQNFRNLNSPEAITQSFQRLLASKVYTEQRRVKLFSENFLIETTWLLMIDLVINKESWLKLSINAEYFTDDYKKMISFVKENEELIKHEESAIKQLAIILTKYFNLSSSTTEGCKFKKISQYIQLVNKDNSLVLLKKSSLIPNQLTEVILSECSSFEVFKNVPVEKIILLENMNVYVLIINEKLKIEDFNKFSVEKILQMTTNNTYQMILNDRLTTEDFISLSNEKIQQIEIHNVYLLLCSGKLKLEEFKDLSEEKMKQLEVSEVFNLFDVGKLNIKDFQDPSFNNKVIDRLKDINIYKLVVKGKLSISDLLQAGENKNLLQPRFFNSHNSSDDGTPTQNKPNEFN